MTYSDCTANNIFKHPTSIFKHPTKAYNRAQRPPVYYYIDVGLSRYYSSRDAMDEPLCGGDKSAPEHRSGRPCNPFQTDIYYIGNLVRHEFMEVRTAPGYPSTQVISFFFLEML